MEIEAKHDGSGIYQPTTGRWRFYRGRIEALHWRPMMYRVIGVPVINQEWDSNQQTLNKHEPWRICGCIPSTHNGYHWITVVDRDRGSNSRDLIWVHGSVPFQELHTGVPDLSLLNPNRNWVQERTRKMLGLKYVGMVPSNTDSQGFSACGSETDSARILETYYTSRWIARLGVGNVPQQIPKYTIWCWDDPYTADGWWVMFASTPV